MAADCKPPVTKPIGLTALAASVLMGCSKFLLYRRIKAGSVPLLPMKGGHEWRISVAGLEHLAGRAFSIGELALAEQRAVEIRAEMRAAKKKSIQKKATP